jgi:hypothetical protein
VDGSPEPFRVGRGTQMRLIFSHEIRWNHWDFTETS